MPIVLRALLNHYRRHPVQALFLVTGIVIANVLLVGTLLINAQARASYAQGETVLNAGPAGQVRTVDAAGRLDERDYIRLRLQGFDMLAPVLRRIVRGAGGEPLEVLGVDLFAMPRGAGDRPVEDRQGRPDFEDFAYPPYQVWAAPARLQQLGWQEGERPPLASGQALPPVRALSGEQLGHRLLIDIGVLQNLTGSRGELSSILVFPAPAERMEALRAALPAGLEYVPGSDAPDPGELTRSFHLNLAAMGLLTFVVGVFLIYNALAFSYTDRRELIRKLQLSGVTRRELAAALLFELVLFLVAGSLAGFWLGAQAAARMLPGVGRTLAQLYDVHIAYPNSLAPGGMALPLLMTALAAGLCVLFPLREALNTPLLERWQTSWRQQTAARRDRLALGVGVILLATAMIVGKLAGSLGWALAGMASLLIGAVLCLPATLRALLALLARWIPDRRVGLGWLIADSRWLLGPASLALMALTLALVANSGLNTMISSFRQATDDWLQQRLAASLYLRADRPLEGLEAWLAERDPALETAERYRTAVQRETPDGRMARLEIVSLREGDLFRNSISLLHAQDDARDRFAAGEGVYVSERAWRLDGWEPGERVRLCGAAAPVSILGVYRDYGNPLSQWLVSRRLFQACWPGLSPSGRAIYGPDTTDWPALVADLRAHYGLEAEEVIDQAELRQAGLAVFDRTFTVTRALNTLTLLVAGIGIFCAISAIHHHRVGQQALLATLGMTRRERGALLMLQWGLLGILCMALVWPFGTVLAGYLAAVVTPVAFGWSFPLRLDWAHYLVLAALSAGCLVLAVLFPSFRLLRTSPAAMLRESVL
ncbi:MAG: ABC transporter permease [Lysobacterales bacterium]|jgi:putative ABC transport system permease protein